MVQQAEFDDIVSKDQYDLIAGVEVKYFAPSRMQMIRMHSRFNEFFGSSFRTSAEFGQPLPSEIYVSGEGPAVVLDRRYLPHGPVEVRDV